MTNLDQKREEIKEKFVELLKRCEIPHMRGIPCVYCDGKELIDQALQSYGEEVAKQTREEVIEEEYTKIFQAIRDGKLELILLTHSTPLPDPLRSTQPKEEK